MRRRARSSKTKRKDLTQIEDAQPRFFSGLPHHRSLSGYALV
jgi:hypothetical protein